MRLFSIFFLLFTLFSCKRNDIVYDIKLEQYAVNVNSGEKLSVKILSGNGAYTLSFSKENIANATVEHNAISINAQQSGTTTLQIVDRKGKIAHLQITVNGNNEDTIEKFLWKTDLVILNQPNSWGLTYSSRSVAVTNVDNKTQYHLAWNGGLSSGQKSNGVLKVVKNGTLTETTLLTTFFIFDRSNKYQITFSKENAIGELLFTK